MVWKFDILRTMLGRPESGLILAEGFTPIEPRESNILKITTTEEISGIPIKGMNNVRDALLAFAMGKTRMSRENVQYEVGQLVQEPRGTFAFLLPDPIAAPQTREENEKIVDRVLADIKRDMNKFGRQKRGGVEYGHHRLDGFTTTTVHLNPLSGNIYILELRGYVGGKQLEGGLAEYLGIDPAERALYGINTAVEFEPYGDQFSIDFDMVLERLQPILDGMKQQPTIKDRTRIVYERLRSGQRETPGSRVVQRIMQKDYIYHSLTPTHVLGRNSDIEVTLKLGEVGDRFETEQFGGKKISPDKFNATGTVLTGPLAPDYKNEGLFIPPSIVISVHKPHVDWYDQKPAIDAQEKQNMRSISTQIAEALATQKRSVEVSSLLSFIDSKL